MEGTNLNNKTKKAKFKKDVYKETAIWKATFQVASTGFIMALFFRFIYIHWSTYVG